MTMKMMMTMMTTMMLMILLVSTRMGKTPDNQKYHFLGNPPVQNLTSQFQDPLSPFQC